MALSPRRPDIKGAYHDLRPVRSGQGQDNKFRNFGPLGPYLLGDPVWLIDQWNRSSAQEKCKFTVKFGLRPEESIERCVFENDYCDLCFAVNAMLFLRLQEDLEM